MGRDESALPRSAARITDPRIRLRRFPPPHSHKSMAGRNWCWMVLQVESIPKKRRNPWFLTLYYTLKISTTSAPFWYFIQFWLWGRHRTDRGTTKCFGGTENWYFHQRHFAYFWSLPCIQYALIYFSAISTLVDF